MQVRGRVLVAMSLTAHGFDRLPTWLRRQGFGSIYFASVSGEPCRDRGKSDIVVGFTLTDLMETPTPDNFLPVDQLLEASRPVRRPVWLWYALGILLIVSIFSENSSAEASPAINALKSLSFVGVGIVALVMLYTGWAETRRQRNEQRLLMSIEEAMQLRRWSDAAGMVQQLLGRPVSHFNVRVQGMIFLANVLTRYHRFADAITVQEQLLGTVQMDPGTTFGLRIGRAMAMLHDDRLVDADRAIGEIRKMNGARESGGLALVEGYRDVKTGHAAEAIEILEGRMKVIRDHLGNRVADGYALLARAHDMLGHADEAGKAWFNATVLTPPAELHRRYPEVGPLIERLSPAIWPREMA